jgi:hypothetical protein
MRNPSPACRVSVSCSRIIISTTVPATMEPTSSPGWMCQARLDAGRDLRKHLNDLPAGDRGRAALEFGALELAREFVDRLLRVRRGRRGIG